MATKSNILKNNIIKALEKHLGVVTSACKEVGCNRSTFYKYYNNDSKFKEKVDELQNVALDFVESKLLQIKLFCSIISSDFKISSEANKDSFLLREMYQRSVTS